MINPDQDLHIAVRKGDKASMERLLKKGVNANCLFYGWTPLQLAIDIGDQETAIFLIEFGCDLEFHDKNSRSPFEEAVSKKEAQVVEALLTKMINGDKIMSNGETPLTYAVTKNCQPLVDVLLRGGANVNKCNKCGYSPLLIASRDGSLDLVKLLISAGADINYSNLETGGYSPLIAAAANEQKAIALFLTKQDCIKLNAQDNDGWTALWHAYSSGSNDICAILLRAGADKNTLNAEGLSVVEDAKSNEDESMVELFSLFNNFF